MKIIKTENKTKELTPYKKKMSGAVELLKKNGKRNLIIACSAVLLGGAVWLNWALFSNADTGEDYDSSIYTANNQTGSGSSSSDTLLESETDSYFAMAQIDRTKARDEALEVLYRITSSEDATSEAKENAFASITRLSTLMEEEANIETLVKSKGFEECIAVLDENQASIVVLSNGLMENEISQILEIVYEQSGITPTNVTIIEKAPS